jgi:hypothetical protein
MWWLNVFFLVHGLWVPGHQMSPEGWSPRSYATEQECLERRAYAERQCKEHPLDYPTAWICSPDNPLTEPPAHMRGRDC